MEDLGMNGERMGLGGRVKTRMKTGEKDLSKWWKG